MDEKPEGLRFPLMDYIMYWYYQIKWRITSKKCYCGDDRYLPHTRTERHGISHGKNICYFVDTNVPWYGERDSNV